MTQDEAKAGEGGQSIREMADAEAQAGEQEEMFPLGTLEGDVPDLRSLIQPHHRVEVTVSMSSAEVPSPSGGLIDPTKEGLALVTYELAKPELVPLRAGERGNRTLEGWKVRQVVRPIYVEGVKGKAGVIQGEFEALLAAAPEEAGALLDVLTAKTSKALATA